MGQPRRITLESWDMGLRNDFHLDGKIVLEIRGATKNGEGQEHFIRLDVGEYELAQLARDLRDKLLELKRYRLQISNAGLEVFKEVS